MQSDTIHARIGKKSIKMSHESQAWHRIEPDHRVTTTDVNLFWNLGSYCCRLSAARSGTRTRTGKGIPRAGKINGSIMQIASSAQQELEIGDRTLDNWPLDAYQPLVHPFSFQHPAPSGDGGGHNSLIRNRSPFDRITMTPRGRVAQVTPSREMPGIVSWTSRCNDSRNRTPRHNDCAQHGIL